MTVIRTSTITALKVIDVKWQRKSMSSAAATVTFDDGSSGDFPFKGYGIAGEMQFIQPGDYYVNDPHWFDGRWNNSGEFVTPEEFAARYMELLSE